MSKSNSIAFANLRAEMAREQLTIQDIAKDLGITRNTLGDKFAGKRDITLDEALRIAKVFFPKKSVYYLFEELTKEEA